MMCIIGRGEGTSPMFNPYLSNEKSLFADNSRTEPTIFSMEKIFMGNPSLRLSELLMAAYIKQLCR